MPNQKCCIRACHNKGGHKFPKDMIARKLWLTAIGRENFPPSTTAVVCKLHFKKSDYIQETTRGGRKPLQQRLQQTAIPSLEICEDTIANETMSTVTTQKRQYVKKIQPKKMHQESATVVTLDCETNTVPDYALEEVITPMKVNVVDQELPCSTTDTFSQTMKIVPLNIYAFFRDPKGIHFYTGLETYDKVLFVFSTLGEATHSLQYYYTNPPPHIDPLNQFFLTMIILRQRKTYFELSRLFNITIKDVMNIFITWIRFMSLQWREIDLWTSRSLVRFYAPKDFKKRYPTTRVILDGTECPIKKPHLPTAQQVTFSTYKNRNTVKVVLGVTPGGLTTFVSPTYGGSTSDRQIIERSNLTTQCDKGDSVMADKGFDIQDMFASK